MLAAVVTLERAIDRVEEGGRRAVMFPDTVMAPDPEVLKECYERIQEVQKRLRARRDSGEPGIWMNAPRQHHGTVVA
jgi:hypothetical protein